MQIDLSIEDSDANYSEGCSLFDIRRDAEMVRKMLDAHGQEDAGVYLRINLSVNGDLVYFGSWTPEIRIWLC